MRSCTFLYGIQFKSDYIHTGSTDWCSVVQFTIIIRSSTCGLSIYIKWETFLEERLNRLQMKIREYIIFLLIRLLIHL